MTRWFERTLRITGIVALIVCSRLAASAANHILDARYLGESSEPVPFARPTADRDTLPPATRDKNGASLAQRNMFCSTCTPEQPTPEPPMVAADGVPLSALPLELLATNLAEPVRASFATIRHMESGAQGSFFIGDNMPSAGPIERIQGASVVFRNPKTDRLERISLLSTAARNAPDKQRSRPTKQAPTSIHDEYIRKIDDSTYEVQRTLVDQLISNPTQLGARILPTLSQDGGVAMKVSGLRANSPLTAIGIKNGDSIEAINGMAMTTDPDKLLEMYTKLSQQQNLSVSIRRRGRTTSLEYRVR